MKIAVLTYNFNNNYGGMLQAYAMMKTLKKLDHKPELLYVQTVELSFKNRLKFFIKKHLLSYFIPKWTELRHQTTIEQNTSYFVNKYITPKTAPLWKEKDFKNITKNNYDAYLVGSDQVWRARLYRYIDYAFFGFVESNKPVFLSYAASFGVDIWEYTEEETKKYKKQLKRFDAISVREASGVTLCKEHFEKDALHVLDPTMLLDPEDYRKIVLDEDEPNQDGNLFTYILDMTDEKKNLVSKVAETLNLRPFSISIKSEDCINLKSKIFPTVTAWLKAFDEAEYIITDSFHGCLFSILFNKPFLVYGNKKRGLARFQSILKIFNLENRLIDTMNSFSEEIILEPINWKNVNQTLNDFRAVSLNYLQVNLKSK